jgi:hypothetical protein
MSGSKPYWVPYFRKKRKGILKAFQVRARSVVLDLLDALHHLGLTISDDALLLGEIPVEVVSAQRPAPGCSCG